MSCTRRVCWCARFVADWPHPLSGDHLARVGRLARANPPRDATNQLNDLRLAAIAYNILDIFAGACVEMLGLQDLFFHVRIWAGKFDEETALASCQRGAAVQNFDKRPRTIGDGAAS